MARARTPSRIPHWFNLKAYDRLAGFETQDWLHVITELTFIGEIGEAMRAAADNEEELLAELEHMFIELQENLGHGGSDVFKERYASNPDVYAFGSVASVNTLVAASMSARLERMEGAQHLIGSLRKVIDADIEEDSDAWREANREVWDQGAFGRVPFFVALRDSDEFAKSPLSLPNHRAVTIDLSVPDATIRQDFDKWLAAMRQLDSDYAAKRPFTSADYQRWVQGGYVPLLMLDGWRRATGARITYGDMCDAAFPMGRRVEVDDVRKTLLPNARSWASMENIEALAVQAANEDAVRHSEE